MARALGREHLRQAAVLAAFVLVTAFVCIVFWPGHIDPDTIDEIGEAASGRYSAVHTPILSALWRGPYLLGLHSPGWLLALGIFSLLVGTYMLLRIRLSRLPAAVAAMACLAFPPVLGWAVHVGRDAWFVALLSCGFGFAARAARRQGRSRQACIAAALVFAFLASASRQNAAPALLFLFLGLAALTLPAWPRFRRGVAVLGAGVAATLLVIVAQSGIQRAVLHAETQSLGGETFVLDLALMSQREGRVLLPADVYSGDLATLQRVASPQGGDNLVFGSTSIVSYILDDQQNASLRSAWLSAVIHHPLDYVYERLRVGGRLVGWNAPSFWVFQYPPGPPELAPKYPGLNSVAIDYLKAFARDGNNAFGGPFESGWPYLIVLVASAAWFLRRRLAAHGFLGLFSLALLAYVLVEVFVVPQALYRYVYPAIAGASVMAVCLAVDAAGVAWRRIMAGRRESHPKPVSEAPAGRDDQVATRV